MAHNEEQLEQAFPSRKLSIAMGSKINDISGYPSSFLLSTSSHSFLSLFFYIYVTRSSLFHGVSFIFRQTCSPFPLKRGKLLDIYNSLLHTHSFWILHRIILENAMARQ